jgi:thymidylate kinase
VSLPESQPIRALFTWFDQHGVRYCHWKSNIRLGETLAGKQDIDVLVHPLDANLLLKAISENGYKLTVAKHGLGHPSVFHATALDETSGKLVDLHAYHQLVSGDSLVKTYRFPIEEQLLAAATIQEGVKVPAPDAELLLFLLRILLKHTSMLETRRVNRHYGKTSRELSWLLERSDADEASRICREWFPTVSVSVSEMIESVSRAELKSRRVRLGRRIGRDLRRLRRLGTLSAELSRTYRVLARSTSRFWPRRDRSLLAGGAWLAFVGPKGTGKSTLSGLVGKAFGKQLDVDVIHFGKPPPTFMSSSGRILSLVARLLHRSGPRTEHGETEADNARQYPLLYVLRKMLLARDRQRLLVRVMRATTAGKIVISDRCPGTNFTGIDGSAFDDEAVKRESSKLKRWLMERERSIYRSLPRPRLVLKLTADLETALQRDNERNKRGGPNPAAIRRRWNLENASEFEGSEVAIVDATGAQDETLRQCLRRAWAAL